MITVPTLLLDEEKCRRNIRMMAGKARQNEVVFRPHYKTHVSHEIGHWFREEGIEKITVSSLTMAQYFAADGWKDILVAFPVNILEMDLINQLAGEIKLSLLVESAEVVDFLSKNLSSNIDVCIKTDTGLNRTGVAYNNFNAISDILKTIRRNELISFRGFLTHAGQSYNARSLDEVTKVHYESISKMAELKHRFRNEFPELIVSVGDTPTCSRMDDFSMVDEIRPGNFVFYDLMQVIIGSCTSEQVAVAMVCPVVAVHKERNEIVIYGGSVHFSKESIIDRSGRTSYGAVVDERGEEWGEIIEGASLIKLSQEHGIINAPLEIVNRYKPGDIIKILPVHSCITASLMKEYRTLDGRIIRRL